jgi:hypothetical protein
LCESAITGLFRSEPPTIMNMKHLARLAALTLALSTAAHAADKFGAPLKKPGAETRAAP